MTDLNKITRPEDHEALIAFCDLTRFAKLSAAMTSRQVFDLISDFCDWTGDIVTAGGGNVIKFIGDEALIVFPDDKVDAGVRSLLELKKVTEKRMSGKDFPSKLIVKCHFGKVTFGLLGTRENKSLDVMGEQVNYAALLQSRGFAMSPEVFRKLKPDTRKLFKKHTPPVRYIPVEEAHRD